MSVECAGARVMNASSNMTSGRESKKRMRLAMMVCFSLMGLAALLAMDRLRPGQERIEQVIRPHIVHLLERAVGDIRHDREFLVGVRQPLEKLQKVVNAGDTVVFAAHDDG